MTAIHRTALQATEQIDLDHEALVDRVAAAMLEQELEVINDFMMKKICPIMSRPKGMIAPVFVLCQGSACIAFGSKPTQIFLAKDGKSETTMWPDTLKLTDKSGIVGGAPHGTVDQTDEINRHVASGWKRVGHGSCVHFTKPGEPTCWCDAMPANAQCGYEAP